MRRIIPCLVVVVFIWMLASNGSAINLLLNNRINLESIVYPISILDTGLNGGNSYNFISTNYYSDNLSIMINKGACHEK
jgi:hypothetical protein